MEARPAMVARGGGDRTPLAASRDESPDEKVLRAGGWPISVALSVNFGILVAVAVTIVLALGLYSGRETSFEQIRDKTELILASVADRVDGELRPAWLQSKFVSEALARGDIPIDDPVRLSDFMIAAMMGTPQVTAMMFVSPDLQAFRITRIDDGFEIDQLSYAGVPEFDTFLDVMSERDEPFWGEVVWSPELEQSLINLRAPVKSNGVFMGVLFSAISVSDFSAYLEGFDDKRTANVFILYGNDKVLAHPALIGGAIELSEENPLPDLPEVGDPILNRTWIGDPPPELPGLEGDTKGYLIDFGSSEYAVLYRDIDEYGEVPWRIGATVAVEDLLAGLERLLYAGIAGVVVLIIALILSYFLGRSMAKPVHRLALAAQDVGHFDFDDVPAIKGGGFSETREAALAFNSMLSGLRAFSIYVPRSLVRRLIRQGDVASLESEEREVTVLFTDIVGFTTQAEGLTPGQTAGLLNQHFTLLTGAVEDDNGTVDKYIGDSVMAFWGAPEIQPDQAKLACASALAMVAAIERDNSRRRAENKLPVRIRIGIHTGPAIVGNVGGPTRVDYTLVGDTVNTASRLVDLARNYMADTDTVSILISERTAAGLDDSFVVERLGEEGIRGRHERLGLCRLLGRAWDIGVPPRKPGS
ncbi:MAG: hypothetical protein GY791_10830 [Alphaproteobacteria bacterium]|nr:hypothetical protein [Alphaproteobacteria bacterium]